MDPNCLFANKKVPSVDLGNQQIRYNQHGKGTLLVCLPAPLLDYRSYCLLQDRLQPYLKTVALDLPRVNSVDEVITILKKTIARGTNYPFHLLASSATGWLAQYLAHQLGDQVQSLTLINSIHSNATYGKKYQVGLKSTKLLPSSRFKAQVLKRTKFLMSGMPSQSGFVNYLHNRIDELGKSGIRQQMSWFLSERRDPPTLAKPVLSLFSSKDPLFDPSDHLKLLHHHPNSTGIKIDTPSHLLSISHTEELADEIVKFIN